MKSTRLVLKDKSLKPYRPCRPASDTQHASDEHRSSLAILGACGHKLMGLLSRSAEMRVCYALGNTRRPPSFRVQAC